MNYTKPRGTVDLIGQDAKNFSIIEDILKIIGSLYNYKEIRTPIFESKDLYCKSVGETSDIVTKEIYDFMDKGERMIALRPEGTAGTIRAIVENKLLLQDGSLNKLFYYGPMFRYERPQSGRQRQFNQFGIECVGTFSKYDEVEVVMFAKKILDYCGIHNYTLEINNIGSSSSRKKWIEELKKYFKKYKNDLSEDSQRRLDKNPLRILDDKIDGKKKFVKDAPKLSVFLSDDEKKYFDELIKIFDAIGVEYIINNNLVRGLDYYNGLVFEFISKSKTISGQSTIIGGGRYDSLIKDTGGPDLPGIGFAIGLERLIIVANEENPNLFFNNILDTIIAPLSEKSLNASVLISEILRSSGISCAINYNSFKLDKHFKFADKNTTKNIIIIGDKELASNKVIVKNQITKKEKEIKIQDLTDYLKKE